MRGIRHVNRNSLSRRFNRHLNDSLASGDVAGMHRKSLEAAHQLTSGDESNKEDDDAMDAAMGHPHGGSHPQSGPGGPAGAAHAASGRHSSLSADESQHEDKRISSANESERTTGKFIQF